jgi:hypothetical protein
MPPQETIKILAGHSLVLEDPLSTEQFTFLNTVDVSAVLRDDRGSVHGAVFLCRPSLEDDAVEITTRRGFVAFRWEAVRINGDKVAVSCAGKPKNFLMKKIAGGLGTPSNPRAPRSLPAAPAKASSCA